MSITGGVSVFILETDESMRSDYVTACRSVVGKYRGFEDPKVFSAGDQRTALKALGHMKKNHPYAPFFAVVGRNTAHPTVDQLALGKMPTPTEYLFGDPTFQNRLDNGGFVVSYTDNPNIVSKVAEFRTGHEKYNNLLWLTADKKITTLSKVFESMRKVIDDPERIVAFRDYTATRDRSLEAVLKLSRW